MSDLFSTGLAGLTIARTALATTAHNTANVYTEGYSRQKALVSSAPALPTGAGFIGTGAHVTTVSRSYDRFLSTQLAQADSSARALETYATQIGRIDNLLADRDAGLAALMQKFFTGVQGVADTPADPAARQQLLSTAQALAGKFCSVDAYLGELNASVNDQVEGSVVQINAIGSQVASLNRQISQLSAATGGQPPNDLLDTRDQLVADLGKLVGVTVVVQDGGQYNLFVASGQTLVLGDRAATMTATASAADPSRKAVALVGTNGQPVELRDGSVTGGALGGILAFRAEALTSTQNAVGRLATVLASAFNAQHRSGTDLLGVSGGDFFSVAGPQVLANDHNTGTLALSASVADASKLAGSDYSIKLASDLSWSVTRLSDGQTVPATLPDGTTASSFTGFPVTFDGVTVAAGAGAAQAGDSFLVQPTRSAARDLAVLVSDPARVAAAGNPLATATSSTTAAIGPVTVDASYRGAPLAAPVILQFHAGPPNTLTGFPAAAPVTVVQSGGTTSSWPAGAAVPYTAGASFSFGGITVALTGTPADLDAFTLTPMASGVADGGNALQLAALQRRALVGNGTASLNAAYAGLVSDVGNRAMEVQVAYGSQSSLAGQVRASQQSVSGVNQDEETANLLMFQQMYQANAKVIQAASTMFDTILGIR